MMQPHVGHPSAGLITPQIFGGFPGRALWASATCGDAKRIIIHRTLQLLFGHFTDVVHAANIILFISLSWLLLFIINIELSWVFFNFMVSGTQHILFVVHHLPSVVHPRARSGAAQRQHWNHKRWSLELNPSISREFLVLQPNISQLKRRHVL